MGVGIYPPSGNDTGWVTGTSIGVTMATGWSYSSMNLRKLGPIAYASGVINVDTTMAAAAASGAHAGNLSDTLICTLPVGWRPAVDVMLSLSSNFGGWGGRLYSTGGLFILDGAPQAVLDSTQQINFYATYPYTPA